MIVDRVFHHPEQYPRPLTHSKSPFPPQPGQSILSETALAASLGYPVPLPSTRGLNAFNASAYVYEDFRDGRGEMVPGICGTDAERDARHSQPRHPPVSRWQTDGTGRVESVAEGDVFDCEWERMERVSLRADCAVDEGGVRWSEGRPRPQVWS
ncbi:hypothetical protein FRC16_008672 [Serendipita sp. 398]|nr:hypothetical protein FRC16_008672 [Serendipita sp. 398]